MWLAWQHGKHQDEPAAVLLGVFSTQKAADDAGADWSEEHPVRETVRRAGGGLYAELGG